MTATRRSLAAEPSTSVRAYVEPRPGHDSLLCWVAVVTPRNVYADGPFPVANAFGASAKAEEVATHVRLFGNASWGRRVTEKAANRYRSKDAAYSVSIERGEVA